MRFLRKAAAIALILVVASAVGVLVAEGALRLVAPQATLFPRYAESYEYPIELPPNVTIVNRQGGRWRYEYTTNALGRRGALHAPAADSTRCTVVLLGDSFTFGVGVGDGDAFSQVMADSLGPGFRVVNGGMGGWGLDAHIKWYHLAGARYRPDHVVLQFTANDPYDDVGVTRIDSGTFRFERFDLDKPRWQWWVSRSALLQNSHLYVLTRTALDRVAAGRAQGSADTTGTGARVTALQQQYVRLLDLFARQLADSGIKLSYVSVTQRFPNERGYGYDIDLFPVIADAVRRMESEGLLTFEPLPLDEMARYGGSPEGHQWSEPHHRFVGTRLAQSVRAGSCGGVRATQPVTD